MTSCPHQVQWPQWGPLLLGYSFENEPVFLNDFNWAVDDVRETLKLKTKSGAAANCLVAQLAASHCRMPCLPYASKILVDIHQIYDQIGMLEGAAMCRPMRTKKEVQFGPGPFEGLWHRHWTQAAFMGKNLSQEFETFGMRDIMRAARSRYGEKVRKGLPIDDEGAKLIANAAVIDTYHSRARRHALTGEWIVFARVGARNIYLTLATHAESKIDPVAIVSRCKLARLEYPELVEVPCLR